MPARGGVKRASNESRGAIIGEMRAAKAQLQHRVGASVAEVEHHDVWQRARITAACVAREHREVERLLDEAERWLRGQEWEIALAERLFVDPEDE